MSCYQVSATYNTSQHSKSVGSYSVRMCAVEDKDFTYNGSDGEPVRNNTSSWICVTTSFHDAINELLDYLGFPVDVYAKITNGEMDYIFLKPVGTKMKGDDFTEYHLLGRRNAHGKWISSHGDDIFS